MASIKQCDRCRRSMRTDRGIYKNDDDLNFWRMNFARDHVSGRDEDHYDLCEDCYQNVVDFIKMGITPVELDLKENPKILGTPDRRTKKCEECGQWDGHYIGCKSIGCICPEFLGVSYPDDPPCPVHDQKEPQNADQTTR